jgi:FtsP/CotA-like multicopper oxidase with cupredoxin domain
MTVTHADGHPVEPVPTGALLIAMGERYDVQVTLGDGVFP